MAAPLAIHPLGLYRRRAVPLRQAFLLIVSGVLGALGATADPPPVAPRPGAVYQLAPGDTLRDLATRCLGGAEYLPELMAYNHIVNPLLVADGTFIAIPGEERAAALAAIAAAQAACQEARDAAAMTYALAEAEAAAVALASANLARNRAAYADARAAAQTALEKALLAKRLADERAPVQEGGLLTAVFGEVRIAPPGGTPAVRAAAGDAVPVGAAVVTGADSRAEVALADGSVVQVLPNSRLDLTHYLRDRRDNRRESALGVTAGAILGKIRPRGTRESTYKVHTREVTIGIRGTDLRVDAGRDEVVRLAVLTGQAEYQARKTTLTVPTNHGTFGQGDGAPADPIALLPPPDIVSPAGTDMTTAHQCYAFAWDAIPSPRFAAFHFELALDAAFITTVEDVLTRAWQHRTKPLADGEYYWRIASVDSKGLEGRARGGKLTVRRQLEVAFAAERPPLVRGDVWVIGPGNRIEAVPTTADTSVVRMEADVGGETSWTFWEPKARFGFPNAGEFSLHVFGTDALGVRGPRVGQKVIVDLTPPLATARLAQAQAGPDGTARVEVILEARDSAGIARLEYRLQGHVLPYTGPFLVPAARLRQLSYQAEDGVGNATAWITPPAAP